MDNVLYEPILMTGVMDPEGTIAYGTLSPLTNLFVAIGKGESFDVLKTDAKGALCNISAKAGKQQVLVPFQSKLEKIEEKYKNVNLYIIPDSIIQDSWFFENGTTPTGKSKPWSNFIREWFKAVDSNTENNVKPIVKKFGKKHLE
jgi:hypothetical protein